MGSDLKVACHHVLIGALAEEATGAVILSFEAKRAKFDRIIARNPGLTLAARQGERMDEAELDGYLADLAELGIADPDDQNGA